ncbi:Mitochondrial inner membrane protease subunit 2, partial [Mucuna pruriens]
MGASSFLWNCTKKFVTAGIITVTVSDRYATIIPVRGGSMSPTFNPKTGSLMEDVFGIFLADGFCCLTINYTADDYVLVEKFCLGKYKFSHGDVVVFRSPLNHKETHIKRIAALPGEWFGTNHNHDVLQIPLGHCWVEGDNTASSMDSKSFGPIPLGLIRGRVTHVVWPPQRIGAVKSTPPQQLSSFYINLSFVDWISINLESLKCLLLSKQ